MRRAWRRWRQNCLDCNHHGRGWRPVVWARCSSHRQTSIAMCRQASAGSRRLEQQRSCLPSRRRDLRCRLGTATSGGKVLLSQELLAVTTRIRGLRNGTLTSKTRGAADAFLCRRVGKACQGLEEGTQQNVFVLGDSHRCANLH